MPTMPIIARQPLMAILAKIPENASVTVTPILLQAIEGDLPAQFKTMSLTLVHATWSDYSDTQDQRDAYRSAAFLVLGDRYMDIYG